MADTISTQVPTISESPSSGNHASGSADIGAPDQQIKGSNESQTWLASFDDPLANLKVVPGCLALDDMESDQNYRLVVADQGDGRSMKLKIYKDTKVAVENTLIDVPIALCTFFTDNNAPHVPAIAVASGAYLYVYRNQRPYFKFTLPPLELNAREKDLWQQAARGELSAYKLQTQLQQLMHEDGQLGLTTRSLRLLGMDAFADPVAAAAAGGEGSSEMVEYVRRVAGSRLRRHTTVTCLAVMKKTANAADSVSCVVIGTESGQVYVLDPEAFTVMQQFDLPSPPGALYTSGTFAGNYRIVVGCRNRFVYTLKRGSELFKYKIELQSAIVGLAVVQKQITVGCMNNTVETFNLHGKRQWHAVMPTTITAVEAMSHTLYQFHGLLVGLGNSEVRIYRNEHLVGMLTLSSPPAALKFGRFGREDGSLVVVTQSGGLHVRMLRRDAAMLGTQPPRIVQDSAAEEQRRGGRKLTIPKKGQQYVLQAIRERDEAEQIYAKSMSDLSVMRLSVAKAYAEMLQAGSLPVSIGDAVSSSSSEQGQSGSHDIRLHGEVRGFGPQFRLHLQVTNMAGSKELCTHLYLGFHYNDRLYAVTPTHLHIPMLVPGIDYRYAVSVECSSGSGQAQNVDVYLFEKKSVCPIVSLSVKMPVSETIILP